MPRQDHAGIVVVLGGDADARAADRNHARHARHFLGDGVGAVGELPPADILDLKEAVAAIAGIDRARVDGLRVDHGGADDQADRHRELGDDQDVPEQARAGRLGRGLVGLEHLRRLEAGEVECGIDAARGADQEGEPKDRQQHAVPAEIDHLEVGIEEGAERRQQQFDQSEREQHRDRRRSAPIRRGTG